MEPSALKGYRGGLLHFLPGGRAEHFTDGLLVVDTVSGCVVDAGKADYLLPLYPAADITVYPDALIMPGMVDCHIHYPQVDVIASYGEQLLQWLNQYTFPTEAGFADDTVAEQTAGFFIDELLKNGTTTAAVFGSVHKTAADAFFRASHARNTRMIMGKSMMDRNTPDNLSESTADSLSATHQLIERWHHYGRQLYAATLRFVVTSTEQQMRDIRSLMNEYPDLYMQTHLAENLHEVELVHKLFPQRRHYLDVFDYHGLLGPRSIFGHCIHLSDDERRRMAATESRIAFCPTSNLFLGSGLFRLEAESGRIRTGIATDVGAGTSFSLLRTLHEAYKVCQLNGSNLSPQRAFYMATLGGAETLSLDDRIGNFSAGKEADFVIFDLQATPLMARRQARCRTLDETLFALMMLGDDRAVKETWIMGEKRYSR